LGGIHTVDPVTGAVTESWMIEGPEADICDLTVMPAM